MTKSRPAVVNEVQLRGDTLVVHRYGQVVHSDFTGIKHLVVKNEGRVEGTVFRGLQSVEIEPRGLVMGNVLIVTASFIAPPDGLNFHDNAIQREES